MTDDIRRTVYNTLVRERRRQLFAEGICYRCGTRKRIEGGSFCRRCGIESQVQMRSATKSKRWRKGGRGRPPIY